MPKKKKTKTAGRRWRPWLLSLLLVPLAVAAGFLLLQRDMIEWDGNGLPSRPVILSPEQLVDGTLRRAIRELGVPLPKIRVMSDGAYRNHYQFRCPERLHPVNANRWFSRILEEEGLRVLDCREEGPGGRPVLEFIVEGGDPPVQARVSIDPPSGDPPLYQDQPILALVIDDFGSNYGPVARGILDLETPLTASILPGLRRSERIEKEARKRGHSVFLHLPMEPLDWPETDPGPGALFVGMSGDSITRILDRHASGFRRLDGLNNHMGSRASQDPELVNAVLDWAARRRLIVLDSWTHPKSRIALLASARGLPPLRSDLFLDGEGEDEAAIADNLLALSELARERGWAVGIGHPRRETLDVLERMLPRLKDYGFRFLTLPQLNEERTALP